MTDDTSSERGITDGYSDDESSDGSSDEQTSGQPRDPETGQFLPADTTKQETDTSPSGSDSTGDNTPHSDDSRVGETSDRRQAERTTTDAQFQQSNDGPSEREENGAANESTSQRSAREKPTEQPERGAPSQREGPRLSGSVRVLAPLGRIDTNHPAVSTGDTIEIVGNSAQRRQRTSGYTGESWVEPQRSGPATAINEGPALQPRPTPSAERVTERRAQPYHSDPGAGRAHKRQTIPRGLQQQRSSGADSGY